MNGKQLDLPICIDGQEICVHIRSDMQHGYAIQNTVDLLVEFFYLWKIILANCRLEQYLLKN